MPTCSLCFLFFCQLFCCLFLHSVIFSPFQCLCTFLSASCLFHLFLIRLSVSTFLADGTCPTFSHSALLSPLLDANLYCGVCHDLSLRDPMPLWDLPGRLSLLPRWNPCHLSTLFSVSLLLFPRWLFLCLKCISLILNTGCNSALQWILVFFYLHLQYQ